MKAKTLKITLGLVSFAYAHAILASQVTPQFLDAIRQVESGGNRYAIGDGGKSRGPYQIKREAWDYVSDLRKRVGAFSVAYDSYVFNESVSRVYAETLCRILETRLCTAILGDTPHPNPYSAGVTKEQIYAAYCVGFARFKKAGFDIKKLPASAQKRIKRILTVKH